MVSQDREIAALKIDANEYDVRVSGVRGLLVRIRPSGQKSFHVRYAGSDGSRRRMTLGDHPIVSVAEARAMAAEAQVRVFRGTDPAADRAALREAAKFGETIGDLSERFMEAAPRGLHGGRGRPLSPSTLSNYRSNLAKYILPVIGKRKIADFRRRDVKAFMHATAAKGLAGATVARIGGVLLSLFSYAVYMDIIEFNPVLGLTRPIAVVSRERMFSEAELRQVWAALKDPASTLSEPIRLAMQLTVLTLSRRSEVTEAEWDEIDFERRLWTMPSERLKQRRAHLVPLSRQAIDVLMRARDIAGSSPYLFPSPRAAGQPIDAHAMSRALTRLCERLELPHRSPHDFRRTAATIMTGEELNIRRFVVSWLLGHAAKEGATVTQVYDRNLYLADRRQALADWADYLDRAPVVDDGHSGDNVIPFRKRA